MYCSRKANVSSRCKAHANLYGYTHRDAQQTVRHAPVRKFIHVRSGQRGPGRRGETAHEKWTNAPPNIVEQETIQKSMDFDIQTYSIFAMNAFSPFAHLPSVRNTFPIEIRNRRQWIAIVMSFNFITFSEMQRCASASKRSANKRRWHFSFEQRSVPQKLTAIKNLFSCHYFLFHRWITWEISLKQLLYWFWL